MARLENNIAVLSDCYGCSLCSHICPKSIITLQLNDKGFYHPVIVENTACTQCGLCLKVCSFHNGLIETNKNVIKAFATWSREPAVRKKASSGGTGFEIARFLLAEGYKVIAVRYNAEQRRAEHYVATSETELIQSMGSKYIQSYSEEAFRSMKKGEKYLVTGTPCQIASMRRYIRMKKMEEDAVLMDFFCHSVPSSLLWNKYIMELESKIGQVVYASWRNKQTGWHDSWAIDIKGEKKVYAKRRSEGDCFYKYFLSDVCFNKACYKDCKFKNLQSAADIRIGDLWGSKYADDEKGVTGVLAFNEKGRTILEECNIELIPERIETVTEGQMKTTVSQPYYYNLLMWLFRTPLKLSQIYRIVQLLRIGTILKYKLHLK